MRAALMSDRPIIGMQLVSNFLAAHCTIDLRACCLAVVNEIHCGRRIGKSMPEKGEVVEEGLQ